MRMSKKEKANLAADVRGKRSTKCRGGSDVPPGPKHAACKGRPYCAVDHAARCRAWHQAKRKAVKS